MVPKGHGKNTKQAPNLDGYFAFSAEYRQIGKMLRITSCL
jgi:hypothetical protein